MNDKRKKRGNTPIKSRSRTFPDWKYKLYMDTMRELGYSSTFAYRLHHNPSRMRKNLDIAVRLDNLTNGMISIYDSMDIDNKIERYGMLSKVLSDAIMKLSELKDDEIAVSMTDFMVLLNCIIKSVIIPYNKKQGDKMLSQIAERYAEVVYDINSPD